MRMTLKIEDNFKYEDNIKHEDEFIYEDDLENEDNLKYEDALKYEENFYQTKCTEMHEFKFAVSLTQPPLPSLSIVKIKLR